MSAEFIDSITGVKCETQWNMSKMQKRKVDNFHRCAMAVTEAFVSYDYDKHGKQVHPTPREIITLMSQSDLKTRSSGSIPTVSDLTQGFQDKNIRQQLINFTTHQGGCFSWADVRKKEFIEDGGNLRGYCFDFRAVSDKVRHQQLVYLAAGISIEKTESILKCFIKRSNNNAI